MVLRKAKKTVFNCQASVLALKISHSFPRVIPQPPSSSDPMSQTQPVHPSQVSDTAGSSLRAPWVKIRSQRAQWHSAQPHNREFSCATEASWPGTCPQTLASDACGYTCVRKNRANLREVSLGLSEPTDGTATGQCCSQVIQLLEATRSRTDGIWLGLQKGVILQPEVLGKTELHLPKMPSNAHPWEWPVARCDGIIEKHWLINVLSTSSVLTSAMRNRQVRNKERLSLQ